MRHLQAFYLVFLTQHMFEYNIFLMDSFTLFKKNYRIHDNSGFRKSSKGVKHRMFNLIPRETQFIMITNHCRTSMSYDLFLIKTRGSIPWYQLVGSTGIVIEWTSCWTVYLCIYIQVGKLSLLL